MDFLSSGCRWQPIGALTRDGKVAPIAEHLVSRKTCAFLDDAEAVQVGE